MGAGLWAWMLLGCRSPEPEPEPVVAAPAPADAPNVVVVSLDTMRSDRLTPYGYGRDTTPFLQELADKGAVFTESYAQAPMTTPSHASMFSGLFPFENHTFKTTHRLPAEIQTIAETFQASGYTTFARASSIRFHPSIDFVQGFEDYKAYWDMPKNRRSDQVIGEVHAFAAEQHEQPVFAFVHLFDPHAPYNAPEPYASTWTTLREDFPPIRSVDYVRANRGARASVDIADLKYIQDLYDGGLRFTDQKLRDLVEGTTFPNKRSTIWVITSDHGEAFKEHGYLGHSKWLYEEIMRVPLVVVWEGELSGGQSHAIPTQSVDLYPTLVDLVGLTGPEGLSGRSLAGPLRGDLAALAQPSEAVEDPLLLMANRRDWSVIATVQGRRFKLVNYHGEPRRLFDLTADPSGFIDVSERHSRIGKILLDYARQRGVLRKPGAPADNTREVSSDEIDMLRALGYVDGEEH
ncbi:MAG: arylsulfatase A-like enzyme [Myxococcota bacterium]|jgi:arylsulfatase A-like enzyme